MKNIRNIVLEKYNDPTKYAKVEDYIYYDKVNQSYVTALSLLLEDGEDSYYTLYALYEHMRIADGDHYVEEGNYIEKEFDTEESDEPEHLEQIREYRDLAGKRVYEVTSEDGKYIDMRIVDEGEEVPEKRVYQVTSEDGKNSNMKIPDEVEEVPVKVRFTRFKRVLLITIIATLVINLFPQDFLYIGKVKNLPIWTLLPISFGALVYIFFPAPKAETESARLFDRYGEIYFLPTLKYDENYYNLYPDSAITEIAYNTYSARVPSDQFNLETLAKYRYKNKSWLFPFEEDDSQTNQKIIDEHNEQEEPLDYNIIEMKFNLKLNCYDIVLKNEVTKRDIVVRDYSIDILHPENYNFELYKGGEHTEKIKLFNNGQFVNRDEVGNNFNRPVLPFKVIGKELIGKYEVSKIVVNNQVFYVSQNEFELNKPFFISGEITIVQNYTRIHPEWQDNYSNTPINNTNRTNANIY